PCAASPVAIEGVRVRSIVLVVVCISTFVADQSAAAQPRAAGSPRPARAGSAASGRPGVPMEPEVSERLITAVIGGEP
ncbi:MAG: hypothetical protein WB684_07830, partial [Gaiella sp.]